MHAGGLDMPIGLKITCREREIKLTFIQNGILFYDIAGPKGAKAATV